MADVPLMLAVVKITAVILATNPNVDLDRKELLCLAENVYHESRGETTQGQLAVAAVTLTRVENARWGSTVCDVVYESKQFSWTNTRKQMRVRNPKAWEKAVEIAAFSMAGFITVDYSNGADHYYSHTILKHPPKWAKGMEVVATVGDHTFLKDLNTDQVMVASR